MKQEEDGKEVTKVLHRYTADKLSSFGELALMWDIYIHICFSYILSVYGYCGFIRKTVVKTPHELVNQDKW